MQKFIAATFPRLAAVSQYTREPVEAVKTITDNGSNYASTRQLGDALKLDRTAAYRRASKALSQGHLVNEADQGKPMRLVIGAPLPDDEVILPEPEAVEAAYCTVASHSAPPHIPTDEIAAFEAELEEARRHAI